MQKLGLNISTLIFGSESQFIHLLILKNALVHVRSNSYNF